MSDHPPPRLHFGGPNQLHRHLRNLLQARIEAVPAGGEIVWATYYFRDRELARALIAASDRGVRVVLHVEGQPRRRDVNHAVLAMLQGHGLAGGLHVHRPALPVIGQAHPHLHSKIYIFSHPHPVAMVGSFNPSGDVPEDEAIIAEIGDQDRGQNLLVELADAQLVHALRQQVLSLKQPLIRLRPGQNRPVRGEDATAWFYPRLRPSVIEHQLKALPRGSRLSGAISHLKKGSLVGCLADAAARGVEVRLIVHDTMRRVPESTVTLLAGEGVEIARYVHPERLPIHAKFLLVEEPRGKSAWFGSFNYNARSRFLNHEVLLQSSHEAITGGLAARFDEILGETEALASA